MSTELVRGADRERSQPTPTAVGWDFEQFVRQLCSKRGYEASSLRAWLDLAEAWKITRALDDCRGNRSAAARELGIGRRTLYAKMEKLQSAPTWKIRTDQPGKAPRESTGRGEELSRERSRQ